MSSPRTSAGGGIDLPTELAVRRMAGWTTPGVARLVTLWAACAIGGACVSYRPPPRLSAPPKLERHAPRDTPRVELAPLPEESAAYRRERFAFAATRPDRAENAQAGGVLRTPHARSRGVVLVLPILGGDYVASDLVASHLTEQGFVTLRFDRRAMLFDPERSFDHVARMTEDAAVDVRRALRWALSMNLDRGRGAAVVGISMGAFLGTLVAATDPNIKAAALLLSGASLPDVLRRARSEEEVGALYAALEARGLSDAQVDERARLELAAVEPARYARHLDPRRTLLVHAALDDVVPYEYGSRLWEAANRPHRVTLLSGHYSAIIYLPYILDAVTDFIGHALR